MQEELSIKMHLLWWLLLNWRKVENNSYLSETYGRSLLWPINHIFGMSFQKTSLNENVELKTDHPKQWQQKRQPWELSKLNIKKQTWRLEMGQKMRKYLSLKTDRRHEKMCTECHSPPEKRRLNGKTSPYIYRRGWNKKKNSDTPKCWQGCNKAGLLRLCRGERRALQPLEKTGWQFPVKQNNATTTQANVTAVLGTWPREMKT